MRYETFENTRANASLATLAKDASKGSRKAWNEYKTNNEGLKERSGNTSPVQIAYNRQLFDRFVELQTLAKHLNRLAGTNFKTQ